MSRKTQADVCTDGRPHVDIRPYVFRNGRYTRVRDAAQEKDEHPACHLFIYTKVNAFRRRPRLPLGIAKQKAAHREREGEGEGEGKGNSVSLPAS